MFNRYYCPGLLLALIVASALIISSAFTVRNATAQVTEITAQDFLDILSEDRAIQIFSAAPLDPSTNADLQAIIDATGPNQTYDFRPFADQDTLSGQGLFQFLTLDEAQSEDIPGSDNPDFADAPYVIAITVGFETENEFGVTVYEYLDITTEDGYERYGSVVPISFTVPGMGTITGTTTTTYDTPKQTWALPLQVNPATEWMSSVTATISTSYDGGLPGSSSMRDEMVDGIVEGYGTLITPAGSFDVIRIRRDETVDDGVNPPMTLAEYDFISPDLSVSVAAMQEQESGTYALTYTTATDDVPAVSEITNGQTGTIFDIGNLGLGLDLTSNSGAGTLTLSRFNTAPLNVSFSGSAEAPDGSTVTPNTIWDGWYYSINNDGLTGFTAEVCVDITGVGGVSNANRLVLLTREFASQAWEPLASFLNGSQLCATVNGFSQFAIGSNAADNALPVELTAFDAALDDGAVQLRWATASETNNAGFEIERAVNGTEGWTQIGFVKGAGTTNAPRQYRFADAQLPFTATRATYRLRQVDTDGAFAYSPEVEVALNAPDQLTLYPSFPNPTVSAATFRYALPKAMPVQLAIYDMLGRRVALVDAGERAAGRQEVVFDASNLASGLYFLRLQAGDQVRTGRFTVVR